MHFESEVEDQTQWKQQSNEQYEIVRNRSWQLAGAPENADLGKGGKSAEGNREIWVGVAWIKQLGLIENYTAFNTANLSLLTTFCEV